MSDDRIAALENRVAALERRRFSSAAITVVGVVALAIAGHIAGTQAQSPSTIRAPFVVVDANGNEIFSVTKVGSGPRVQLHDAATADGEVVAAWGGEKDTAYLALGGKESKGIARLGINFNGEKAGPSLLLADTEHDIMSIDKDQAEIATPLEVTDKLTVSASKGGNSASLAPTNLSIHGRDGKSVAASLGLDNAGQGRLVVGSPAGARGVLGHSKEGVSFALYDGVSAAYRVGLLVEPKGTSLLGMRGGKRVIMMDVSPVSGSLHFSNDAGHSVVQLDMVSGGSGELSLGDSNGTTMVEAGTTVDGVGIVRAGPRLGGTTGVSQGGMVLPHSIVGQGGRK